MTQKTASLVSSIITFVLAVFLVVFWGFMGLVALNGFMSADAAVYTGFACLSIGVILCAILAWMLTKFFISRFKWKNAIAIVVSVIVSSILNGGLGFVSIFIMVIVADATH